MGESKQVMYIVDPDTGEVVGEVEQGGRYFSPEQIGASRRYWEERNNGEANWGGYESFQLAEWQKINSGELRELNKELSKSEKAFLFSVFPHVGYGNGQICLTENGKREYELTLGQLGEICGMSRNSVVKCVESLSEKRIIAVDSVRGKANASIYIVNPWVCVKGRRINGNLKILFRDYRIRSLGGIKWGELEKE